MERRIGDGTFKRPNVHSVTLTGRELMSVTGVSNVESFNDNEVELTTDCGELRIEGSGLHITKLNLDDGQVIIEGTVFAMEYSDDEPVSKGSIFRRMFG